MWKKIEYFLLIIIIGMKGFVQGSCLEYGHSCWGAHGKRSDKTVPSSSVSIENIRYKQNSKDLTSAEGLIPQQYILLNILLNKNSIDNYEENLNNSDHPILLTENDIDYRKLLDSNHDWNLKKMQVPLRKRQYFGRTSIPQDNHQELLIPIKSRISQNNDFKNEQTFDPYNFLLNKSSKSQTNENKHYLQSDIYSDEDQNLQDLPLK